MVGHRKTTRRKICGYDFCPKETRPKSRAKTPIAPKQRRRLTMLTRKYIMPNILSGAIKIQKKYVAKKAAKKEEKILNGGVRPVNSRFSSSSDESSSSDKRREVMSLLQIERPPEEAEEERKKKNFLQTTLCLPRE